MIFPEEGPVTEDLNEMLRIFS